MAQSRRRPFHIVDPTGLPPSANDSEESVGAAPQSVASILKAAREEIGLTLWEVSQNLRIRFSYMQAIEDGRFEDLPGSVYAIGFIRTYALYLNLDADELISRFKNEQSALTQRQNLVFPAPPPTSRVSGVAIGLVAIVLAAAAYGGWYYLSSEDSQEVAVVAPVPDRLATLLEEQPPLADTEAPEPVATELATAEETSEPTDFSSPLPELPAAEAADIEEAIIPDVAPGQADPEPIDQPLAEAPGDEAEQFLAVDSVGAAPLDQSESEALGLLISAGPETSADETEALAPPPEPPATPEAAQPATAGNRIEMRATTDSWVLVRDAGGDMIMTRVMTPGDSYQVPDEPGLTLFTGNAGGLEVLVDGQAVPALGQPGEVIRNISLDPDLLRNGRAVISQ
ncbi:MAG: RodZ domain-containing protein [Pseudomonadota bacterium]